jgi:hypothetical protein
VSDYAASEIHHSTRRVWQSLPRFPERAGARDTHGSPDRLAAVFGIGKSSLTISARPDGVGAVSQRLIPTGEQSGLRMHTVTTESGVHADEKLTAFMELESAICNHQRLAPAIG